MDEYYKTALKHITILTLIQMCLFLLIIFLANTNEESNRALQEVIAVSPDAMMVFLTFFGGGFLIFVVICLFGHLAEKYGKHFIR